MNAEHILNAIGLLDDGLIREAERYRRPRPRINYNTLFSLASCLALVLVLGYGVTHLELSGGGNSAAPMTPAGGDGASTPAASAPPADNAPSGSCAGGELLPEEQGPVSDEPEGPGVPGAPEGEFCPAIMVDGILYRSTGRAVPVEPDPNAVKTVSSYTGGTPETDGQTNFSQDLNAQYAMIKIGQEWKLVVLMESEWVLFEPAPAE